MQLNLTVTFEDVEMAQEEYPKMRFSSDDAQAIIKRAIERSSSAGSVAFTDLAETAKELGIDAGDLAAAIEEHEAMREVEEARNRWRRWRKKKFNQHLRSYIIVNAALMIFSILSGGAWFLFPLVGWGIGLAFDFAATYYPSDRDIERGTMSALKRMRKERQNVQPESVRNYTRSRPENQDYTAPKPPTEKTFTVNFDKGKIVITKGDKKIEIGDK